MDFHSLTRRALQSLCKKNKIQANMTNVAMADALGALPVVEGAEEFFQQTQHLLSSKKKPELKTSGRKKTAAPPEPKEPQGSPLPRSRRVTARAPQVPKPDDSEEERKEKEEEKTAGVTTRRRTTGRSTTKEAGGVDVGTRRSTRGRAASKMADLRTEEEEEEAKDVVENVVSNDETREEMETKEEGEGKKETNPVLPVEQPKEDQKEEAAAAEFSDGEIQEAAEHPVLNDVEASKFSNGGIQVAEHTSVLNDEVGVGAAQMNVEISMIDQNTEEKNRESEEEEEGGGEEQEEAEFSVGGIQEVEEHSALNDEEEAEFSDGGIQEVEQHSALNDEEEAEFSDGGIQEHEERSALNDKEEAEFSDGGIQEHEEHSALNDEEEAECSDGGIQELEHEEHSALNDDEEAEFSDGGIQEVEEHSALFCAAKFSDGGIQVEHTSVLNDELGVEAAQMNVEISMITQNRDIEEEEEEEQNTEDAHNFQGSPVGGLISSEPMTEQFSVDVPAATDQASQVGIDESSSDDKTSPAKLVQEDGPGSVEFVNGSVESAHHHDLTVEIEKSGGNGSALTAQISTEENEQSSNGDDDADHTAAADDNDDNFAEEESGEAAEISNTNEEEPEEEDFGDELDGDSAREVNMEEKKQFSNGDHTDHADGGDDDDHTLKEEELREAAAEISDENEKEEEIEKSGGNDSALTAQISAEENEQSSNGDDDADHAAAADDDDDDNFAEEEEYREAAEISKTNEEEPEEDFGHSAIDIPVEVEDFDLLAREVNMEEKKQFSNGDHTDHADGGDDDDHTLKEEEFREAAAEISDENEKEEEMEEQYNDIGNDPAANNSMTPLEMEDSGEELENTNDSGGDSAIIDVPVQIEDFGDEDIVVSGHLVGEIAVEAAAATSYFPAEKVLSSEESPGNIDNNNKENAGQAQPPGPNGVGDDGCRKEAKWEDLSLRKLKAMYKEVINKNKGEEKKRPALQALDENCLSLK